MTVESSSIIEVDGDRIGVEFLLGRFDREVSWLLGERAKGGQRGRWEVRLEGSFTCHGDNKSA